MEHATAGTHTLTAQVTDSLGVVASSVEDDLIDIDGTFQAPPNSAVDINDTLATMTDDGKFFINNVQLAPGANTLTLTVTTMDGQTAKRDITIVSTAAAPFTFLQPRIRGANRCQPDCSWTAGAMRHTRASS